MPKIPRALQVLQALQALRQELTGKRNTKEHDGAMRRGSQEPQLKRQGVPKDLVHLGDREIRAQGWMVTYRGGGVENTPRSDPMRIECWSVLLVITLIKP